jgi:hypothetical protein
MGKDDDGKRKDAPGGAEALARFRQYDFKAVRARCARACRVRAPVVGCVCRVTHSMP